MSESKEIVPAVSNSVLTIADAGGGQFTYSAAADLIRSQAASAGLSLSSGKVKKLFYLALNKLRSDKGIHIRGLRGVYRVLTADEMFARVTVTNRLAVVHRAVIANREAVGAQHAPGISEEMRVRLNHEERRLSSGLMHVEAAYLKRQRVKESKPPPGIEEE